MQSHLQIITHFGRSNGTVGVIETYRACIPCRCLPLNGFVSERVGVRGNCIKKLRSGTLTSISICDEQVIKVDIVAH